MHIRALKVFCEVAGRRSFSRAADAHGLTQPAVSQLVQQLEESLGVKLIDRSQRPLGLTSEGEVFHQGCQKLLHDYDALEERVRSLHEEINGRVRVASIYSVGLSHMNRSIREFMSAHPDATVQIQYQHPADVNRLVEQGDVDLGLVSYPRSSSAVEASAWREENMVVAVAPEHPLARRDTISVSDLNGCDFVAFDEHLQIRREIDRLFAQHAVKVQVRQVFDNVETMKRAIEINLGVGLLPEPTVSREVASGALVARSLSDAPLRRPLGVIRHRGWPLGRAAEAFFQYLLTCDDASPAPSATAAEAVAS